MPMIRSNEDRIKTISQLVGRIDGPVALILRGLPGCGKTDLALAVTRSGRSFSHGQIIEMGIRPPHGRAAVEQDCTPDYDAINGQCFRGYLEALRLAGSYTGIVASVHNTMASHVDLEPYRLAAVAHGIYPLIVRIDSPPDFCMTQQTRGLSLAEMYRIHESLTKPLPDHVVGQAIIR